MRANRAAYAVAALFLAACFATLGSWQLQRGHDKRDRIEQQQVALAPGSARALTDALLEADRDGIDRVAGHGNFLEPMLLLDNQQRGGRVGIRVYGMAEVEGAARALLVDLGWLPLAGDRRLPEVKTPSGRVELRGLLAPWPGQGLRLAETTWPVDPATPPLLNHLDADEIAQRFGRDLAPRVLRLAPELPYGHARDLDLLPNTLPPERHFGYAVQWFALSATVVAVFLILSWRTRRRPSP